MKMGTLLIIIGVMMTASGICMTIKTDSTQGNKPQPALQSDSPRNEPKPESSQHSGTRSQKTPSTDDSYSQIRKQEKPYNSVPSENVEKDDKVVETELTAKEKGNDFEAYLADIFQANHLSIKEWNQGTITDNGAMGENALRPDFHIEQSTRKSTIDYWVEAKWRKRIGNENFNLRPDQLTRYRKFERTEKRKVIICLGVGGEPKAPKAVYVIPIDSMPNEGLSYEELKAFHIKSPETNLPLHIRDWFFSEVFKK